MPDREGGVEIPEEVQDDPQEDSDHGQDFSCNTVSNCFIAEQQSPASTAKCLNPRYTFLLTFQLLQPSRPAVAGRIIGVSGRRTLSQRSSRRKYVWIASARLGWNQFFFYSLFFKT